MADATNIEPVEEETITLNGRQYRVLYAARGDFIRADGTGVIPGIEFIGVALFSSRVKR